LIKESLLPLDHFIYEHVQAASWPFDVDLVDPNHLVEILNQFSLRGTTKDISRSFNKLGYKELARVRVAVSNGNGNGTQSNGNGTNPRLRIWAVRNFAEYIDSATDQLRLTNDQLRTLFSAQYGKQQSDHILNQRGASNEEELLRRRQPVNLIKANEPIH